MLSLLQKVTLKSCYGYNTTTQAVSVAGSSVTVIGFQNVGGTEQQDLI